MGSYHPYYLLEAVIFTLVGLTYFVLYALQIRSERIFSDKMGRVHRTFHYGGFAMSITLIVSGLDPQGVLGILPWQAVLLVKDLFTCIAYICLALWTVQLVLIISETSGQTSKTTTFLYKNYVESALVSAGINLIVCLACDLVAISKNNTGSRGFFLIYLAFSFLLAAGLMTYCIVDYVKTHKKVTQNSAGRVNSSSGGSGEGSRSSSACCGSRWCAKETTKLRNTILAFTFIGLFQLQGGLSILSNPIQLSTEQVPVDTQNVHVFVWILPFWVGIGIGLYASWLPLGCVSSNKNSKHSVDRVQSASKPKDSMEVVSAQPMSPTAHQAEV